MLVRIRIPNRLWVDTDSALRKIKDIVYYGGQSRNRPYLSYHTDTDTYMFVEVSDMLPDGSSDSMAEVQAILVHLARHALQGKDNPILLDMPSSSEPTQSKRISYIYGGSYHMYSIDDDIEQDILRVMDDRLPV